MNAAAARVYAALVHYPVYNREGDIVATSVTPLDVHDLGRLALTYGVKGYYITNPYEPQQRLVAEIIHHWRAGLGGDHSPHRKLALSRARGAADVTEVFDDVAARESEEPWVVATTARAWPGAAAIPEAIAGAGSKPVLLLFGTGYGLTDDLLAAADAVLRPIAGDAAFNHLPVRAAMAIYFDRIFGGAAAAT